MLDLSFLVAFETGFNICHLVTNSFIAAVLNLSTSFDISQKDKNEIQVLPVHPFTEHLRDFVLKVILILTLRWDISNFVFVLLFWGLSYNGKNCFGRGNRTLFFSSDFSCPDVLPLQFVDQSRIHFLPSRRQPRSSHLQFNKKEFWQKRFIDDFNGTK
jgi:hypothetical protein